jgi:hypothetical protein
MGVSFVVTGLRRPGRFVPAPFRKISKLEIRYNWGMKTRRIILAAFLLLVAQSLWADDTSVLFIGNSHTGANDLPGLFEGLALAGGKSVYVDQSVFGGSTLEFHFANAQTRALVIEREWDRVVLQEHSLYPVIEHWRDESFYPAVRDYHELITSTGSQMALFMTWGYEFAAGPYCVSGYCSPEFSGYFDMQAHLTAAYTAIAFEVDAMLAPVGEVFAAALTLDPGSPLWLPDNYHPSAEGSYLAACVFYTRIFSESPIGLDFYGGLDPARALFYQQVAAEASAVDENELTEFSHRLFAFPNPSNPTTDISFELSEAGTVKLDVYNVSGRRVSKLSSGEVLMAGMHHFQWDGRNDAGASLPSGVYLVALSSGGQRSSTKVCLMK